MSSSKLAGHDRLYEHLIFIVFFELINMDVDDEITSKNRGIPVFLPGKGAENTLSLTGLLQHCVPFGYRNCILYTL